MAYKFNPFTGKLDEVGESTAPTASSVTFTPQGAISATNVQTAIKELDDEKEPLLADASDTVKGKVELATIAETDTGTDATRAVTPDALAGSYAGKQTVSLFVFGADSSVTTGDGAMYFVVPESFNGMNLTAVHARVITAGTTNTTDIQIANVTDSVDMLSTKITIDSTETGSNTGATPAVIDTSKDDVATYDLLRVDVDAVSTTKPKGLLITLTFNLP